MAENDTGAGVYRIVEAQLPPDWPKVHIEGPGAHDLIVVLDPKGHVVKEFDGLAEDKSHNVKPIGYLPTDRLKVHEFDQAAYYSTRWHQVTLKEGPMKELQPLIKAAEEAKTMINARDLHYPPLAMGDNSNAVASTLIKAMGLVEPRLHFFTPSKGALLLNHDQISKIQRDNGITPATTQTKTGQIPPEPKHLSNADRVHGAIDVINNLVEMAKHGNATDAKAAKGTLQDIMTEISRGTNSNANFDQQVAWLKNRMNNELLLAQTADRDRMARVRVASR